MLKKQEIKSQQNELHYHEEMLKRREQRTFAMEEDFRCSPDMHGEDIVAAGNVMRPQASSRSDDLQQLLEKQQQTMNEAVRGLRMPQREYMAFSGELHAFPLFMKNFEVNVEAKEQNGIDRLNFLIQYCGVKAREAIEHCIIMPPKEGYKRAKEILRKNFGRTHIVTKAFMDKVLGSPAIQTPDPEKLSQLACAFLDQLS